MHNALLISELLSPILDCLANDTVLLPLSYPPQNTYGPGWQALAALARLAVLSSNLHSMPFGVSYTP